MADPFTPNTTITFSFTGVDDHNKTVHNSASEFVQWAATPPHRLGAPMQNCSFQRVDENWECRVASDAILYSQILLADTIILQNQGEYNFVGIIDRVEWKNPHCYHVYFHIDWYSSLLGFVKLEDTYAFIEREHVEKDWNGANPMFSNMGPAEGFNTRPDTPIFVENIPYAFRENKVCVYSPYDDAGQPNFVGTMQNGLYSAMFQKIMTADECNDYLKKIAETTVADLANIASIVSVPDVWAKDQFHQQFVIPMPWIEHVSAVPTLNNAKCWSGEFCQIKLESGTGQSLSVNTQWFGNDKDHYNIDVNAFLVNGDGGCMATFVNENGTYTNDNNKKCYGDFSVSLIGLPQSPWVGNAFAQWKAANALGMTLSTIGSVFASASGIIGSMAEKEPVSVKQGVTALGRGFQIAGRVEQNIQNAQTSGTAVGGTIATDVNTAVALDRYGFQVIHYMCQSYIMQSVDSYFDRFGYKVNRLKTINRKARPKWTYVKCAEVHAMPGPVPMRGRQYIEQILNDGVTFWMDPDKIGDYSDPAGNKGV